VSVDGQSIPPQAGEAKQLWNADLRPSRNARLQNDGDNVERGALALARPVGVAHLRL